MHPDLKGSGDTSYIESYTDVNADGVLKLQHYQDTYTLICTKLAVKWPSNIIYIDYHLKSLDYVLQ